MKNPSTCSPAITPYIAITRPRSTGVIAVNDGPQNRHHALGLMASQRRRGKSC